MLEIRNVTKSYGRKIALREISLSLTAGVYGLLGPNGAGKSTLMNLITENSKPDQGEICWKGKEIGKYGSGYRKILGYAPQQQGLYDSFTGKRFLGYMGALKKIRGQLLQQEVERVAAYVNLTEMLDRKIAAYSGGMKQRLLIAQAMMGTPELIVLDEPTAGLDPKERVRVREKIGELAEGRIILVATHIVSDIQSIAGEVILLKDGGIAAKGSVEALCRKYGGGESLEEIYMKIFGEGEQESEPVNFV